MLIFDVQIKKTFQFLCLCVCFTFSLACSKKTSTYNADPPNNDTPNNTNEDTQPPKTACEASLSFSNNAVSDPQNKERLSGTLTYEDIRTNTSCSGENSYADVFNYVPKSDGLLRVVLASENNVFLSIQNTCEPPSEEWACTPSQHPVELKTRQGIPLTFVVASEASNILPLNYTLTASFLPYVSLNAPCDPDNIQNTCAENLRCDTSLVTAVCVENQAPTLLTSTAYQSGRFGEDLYLHLEGTDANNDVVSAVIDENPYAFTRIDYTNHGFDAYLYAYGFFILHPSEQEIHTSVLDSGNLFSNTMNSPITTAPTVSNGASCDPDEMKNICNTGYYCHHQTQVCTQGNPPVLTGLGFFNNDTFGDKRIAIEGHDGNNDIVKITLSFLNNEQESVSIPLNGTQRSSLDIAVTQQSHMPDFYKLVRANTLSNLVTHIAAQLTDRTGLTSQRTVVQLSTMPVLNTHATCDKERRFNRCNTGLICDSLSETCTEGQAPRIDTAAYLRKPSGVFVLISAEDFNDDLATATLEFLDGDENPVLLFDSNNDTVSDTHATVQQASGFENDTHMALLTYEVTELAGYASKTAITLTDFTGLQSSRQVFSITEPEIRSVSEACDILGFNVCEAGSKCSPQGFCTPLATLRATTCGSAPSLTETPLVAHTTQPSLWDPPNACTQSHPRGASEAVFSLTLPQEANTLRISTQNPQTTYDTILYVLPGCGETNAEVLGCNDDTNAHQGMYTSELVLHNVPAGHYLVVADSYTSFGGNVEIHVEVE